MSMTPADARFFFRRALGLVHRGLSSLHARGWRATWERTKVQFARRAAPSPQAAPWRPGRSPFAPFAMPAAWSSPAPTASVVIPVYGQFARTLECLRALAAHPCAAAAEVIVVDDGSPDETPEAMPRIEGVRYHRRAQNGGFIAACNDGAALARGEYVVFLNNDTIPQAGWLDALLRTFEDHADVGLVGAQLRYPDGRLQEAGGVVFSDGSAWNYGRFESPEDCRYAYVRDCDYASGAAIALPRALFEDIGGFSTLYAPAYYEDTDLAFAVRARGKRVLYQPESVVVHDEGGTAGTDVNTGQKAYQVRNQAKFAERWRDALATHLPPGTVPTPANLHKRQVLIVDALTPRPDHDSGSLRMVNLMRLLQQEGAHVVFLPANRAHDGEATLALQRMGVEAWHAPWAERAPAWFRMHGPRFDAIVLCRHYVASEMLPLARRHAPQARVVFDSVDLHYLRERRGAEVAGDRALARAAERTRALELDVIARSDATLVVSDVEQALLATDAPNARVAVVSNLHRIAGAGHPFVERSDLVFVGGFRHPPNVDAVRWFIGDILPRVRERLPAIRFHCIGSHATEEILALADRPGVVMHGHVPDIAPFMDGARIALAPLRFGAGVKGKVNLSMAHGQPVVATSCAVEGMHLHDGEDVLVADEANAFADAIVRLHEDEALWTRLRDAGLHSVARHFSLDAARPVVREVVLGIE
ncbi:glycosyltransferase [Lysobacter sp. KIS68-7]|uniref:glycosyltransferase n=1 Tax=Lysobacter sp. KIS68-7 TaxID=2904252 RepID=UPI001E336D47|nr:glycosyltransferase [Lysobacter sp. KIS68-7]UHQ19817.1 glycosyltransferase [Lysobacter sp. KIS68-7]